MKINLKESIAGLKQDGKHTPKSIIFIFMLVVICVEVGMIVYSNLVELQYHLGFDASSAYLHAVEMWREKSLIPSTFAITTTLGLDAPDALAALFYGITGNIFLSFGIANLILDVIICISFYQILKEINLTPFTRILGMVFLLCPFMTPDHFTDNNLSYFAMVFGEQGSYSIKIIAMMLLFLTIIKFEHNKKCYKTMIFATLFNMLTCVSSGIYVAITILVPCVVYYLVKMVYENSYKVLKNTGLIFALVELVLSFIGKASTGLIMSFQSHESNMVLTGIHQFWTNIGSLIMGYFQLFCGISIETVVSLFSLRGILQIMSVAFILFMFILCVISVVFLIRHIKAKEKDFSIVLPYIIIFINIAVFIFSYTLYDGVFFEYRYLIIVYLMQILICCSTLEKIDDKFIFKNAIIVAISGILMLETVGILNYYHNDTIDKDVVYDLLDSVDSLDVPVAYVWGNSTTIDARNFRILDLSVVYKGLSYGSYNEGTNWGDYNYYDENSTWTGKTALITTPDEFEELPEFISKHYELYDFFGDYQVYKSDINPFDLTAFDNNSKENINFMYSAGTNFEEEDLDEDGYYTTNDEVSGDMFNMVLLGVGAGSYDIVLECEVLEFDEDSEAHFEARDIGTDESIATVDIKEGNTNVELKNVTLDDTTNVLLKVDQTTNTSIKLKKVKITKL